MHKTEKEIYTHLLLDRVNTSQKKKIKETRDIHLILWNLEREINMGYTLSDGTHAKNINIYI
jgi:hypothetical protein